MEAEAVTFAPEIAKAGLHAPAAPGTVTGCGKGDPMAFVSAWEPAEDADERNRKLAEAEARGKRAERLAKFEALCPPVYRHPEILAALRNRVPASIRRSVAEWRPSGLKSGLLLHGPTGGFKTTLLFRIAERVIIESGERAELMNGETFAREAAAAFGDPAKTAEWLKRFKTAQWLFVDELFKGNMTPSATSALFEIIEHRTAHLLPTVATTNATGERVAASTRDPSAQETIPPILRRIRGEPGRPGFFDEIEIPCE